MSPKGKTKTIKEGEYEHLSEIGVAYEGFVESENGDVFYVFCEATVVGYFENKYHIMYGTSTASHEVLVCDRDNTYVKTQNPNIEKEYNSQSETIKNGVRQQLLKGLESYYQNQEYNRRYGNKNGENKSPFEIIDATQIKIDVPEPKRRAYYQDEFAELKRKIENGTIKRNDFKQNIIFSLKREIDMYFACFDPHDHNYKSFWATEREGKWDDMIPVWGNVKMASKSLDKGFTGQGPGHYFHALGYFLMGFADILCFGVGTASVSTANLTPARAIPAYFPTIKDGWGVFGKEGLFINNYKIEMMYQYGAKAGGGGTVFSIESIQKGKNLFRIDYGRHKKSVEAYWHMHGRWYINDVKYGSNKPHRLF